MRHAEVYTDGRGHIVKLWSAGELVHITEALASILNGASINSEVERLLMGPLSGRTRESVRSKIKRELRR